MKRQNMGHLRLSDDEIWKCGCELYEQLRLLIETEENLGRICAIDVETGDYLIADDVLDAAKPLHAKHPGAAVWGERIGYNVIYEWSGFADMEFQDECAAWERASDKAWRLMDDWEQEQTQSQREK